MNTTAHYFSLSVSESRLVVLFVSCFFFLFLFFFILNQYSKGEIETFMGDNCQTSFCFLLERGLI